MEMQTNVAHVEIMQNMQTDIMIRILTIYQHVSTKIL